MSMREVFRVIYAPHKAFKEIIQKPGYKGPLIIMLLFVLSFSGFYYVFSIRVYYDQTKPELSDLDKWTEDASLWRSSAKVSENNVDYIKGNYYGNKSIQFTMENNSRIDMELRIPEPLNCIEPNNYTSLSFRIKIMVEPSEKPVNISIRLLSKYDENKYFNYLLPVSNVEINSWNNETIPLANFANVGGADWRNITSLKFELKWIGNKNITALIDGVFFHGYYKSIFEINGSAIIFNSVISGFMQFTIQWTILSIILYLFSKLFKAQPVWKTTLTISGFVLITFFIQNLILISVVLAYPEMHLSLETLGGVPGEGVTTDAQNYMSIITIKFFVLDRIIYYGWIVALCSIAVHLLFEFPWTRSFSVSLLSSMASMLAFRFLVYQMVWF